MKPFSFTSLKKLTMIKLIKLSSHVVFFLQSSNHNVELNLYKIQTCESMKDAHKLQSWESQDVMSKTKSFCYNF